MDLATAKAELTTFLELEGAYRANPAVTASPWVDRRLRGPELIVTDLTFHDLVALDQAVNHDFAIFGIDGTLERVQDFLKTTRGRSKKTAIQKHPKASGAYLSYSALEVLAGHVSSL